MLLAVYTRTVRYLTWGLCGCVLAVNTVLADLPTEDPTESQGDEVCSELEHYQESALVSAPEDRVSIVDVSRGGHFAGAFQDDQDIDSATEAGEVMSLQQLFCGEADDETADSSARQRGANMVDCSCPTGDSAFNHNWQVKDSCWFIKQGGALPEPYTLHVGGTYTIDTLLLAPECEDSWPVCGECEQFDGPFCVDSCNSTQISASIGSTVLGSMTVGSHSVPACWHQTTVSCKGCDNECVPLGNYSGGSYGQTFIDELLFTIPTSFGTGKKTLNFKLKNKIEKSVEVTLIKPGYELALTKFDIKDSSADVKVGGSYETKVEIKNFGTEIVGDDAHEDFTIRLWRASNADLNIGDDNNCQKPDFSNSAWEPIGTETEVGLIFSGGSSKKINVTIPFSPDLADYEDSCKFHYAAQLYAPPDATQKNNKSCIDTLTFKSKAVFVPFNSTTKKGFKVLNKQLLEPDQPIEFITSFKNKGNRPTDDTLVATLFVGTTKYGNNGGKKSALATYDIGELAIKEKVTLQPGIADQPLLSPHNFTLNANKTYWMWMKLQTPGDCDKATSAQFKSNAVKFKL